MTKKPINRNTATKDELMTITDIGETRPGMFIKDRSKAALNLELLKLIKNITCRTMFLTLIQNNRQAREACKAIPQTLIQNC
jgi:hypothetical protein